MNVILKVVSELLVSRLLDHILRGLLKWWFHEWRNCWSTSTMLHSDYIKKANHILSLRNQDDTESKLLIIVGSMWGIEILIGLVLLIHCIESSPVLSHMLSLFHLVDMCSSGRNHRVFRRRISNHQVVRWDRNYTLHTKNTCDKANMYLLKKCVRTHDNNRQIAWRKRSMNSWTLDNGRRVGGSFVKDIGEENLTCFFLQSTIYLYFTWTIIYVILACM